MLFSTLALPADPTITSAVYSDKGIDIPHTVTFKIVKDIPWNDVSNFIYANKKRDRFDLRRDILISHYACRPT